MPSLVDVDANNGQEGKDGKEGKDDKDSFLSQFHEKLCSSDHTLLVTKLFNMLRNDSNYNPDVLNTANDNTVCPLEADNLDMSLSGFESATNEKEMAIDMGIKEQLFKSKYTSPRAINAEEHMKLVHIARQPVNESKLLLETNHHHILQIDLLEMLYDF